SPRSPSGGGRRRRSAGARRLRRATRAARGEWVRPRDAVVRESRAPRARARRGSPRLPVRGSRPRPSASNVSCHAEVDGPFSLHGKRSLVTGGGRGIGRAIALALSGAGADVALPTRDATGAQ